MQLTVARQIATHPMMLGHAGYAVITSAITFVGRSPSKALWVELTILDRLFGDVGATYFTSDTIVDSAGLVDISPKHFGRQNNTTACDHR